ncbi:MAG: biotin/lipoyl-containing protein, partial [Gammaproteobacteria bacterium]
MSTKIPVSVPDIGDFEEVEVIEILVAIGDTVEIEDPLVTLESDKATMDIPAPQRGEIVEISVSLGDKVAEGSVIVTITASDDEVSNGTAPAADSPDIATPNGEDNTTATQEIIVPDIGDFDSVDVIEILVQPGDVVALEDPLITLESDKATMDIPAPGPGTVEKIMVAVGDKVSEGHAIVLLNVLASEPATETKVDAPAPPTPDTELRETSAATAVKAPVAAEPIARESQAKAYASPSMRKFARELGVDLNLVSGTGRKGRII